jgi:hypothetical protein
VTKVSFTPDMFAMRITLPRWMSLPFPDLRIAAPENVQLPAAALFLCEGA